MSDTYRVLVTSSRTWQARTALYAALDGAERRAFDAGYRTVVIVHGNARGGDRIADDWTRLPSPLPGMTRRPERHPVTRADWYPGGRFDPAAGMRRNARMADLGAHECVAAADECAKATCRRKKPHDSHGTANAMALASKAGIEVRRVTADD